MSLNKRIGDNLKTVLKDRGITQAEFASLVGCSQSLICGYCNGTIMPPVHRLLKISEVLEIPVSYFISYEKLSF